VNNSNLHPILHCFQVTLRIIGQIVAFDKGYFPLTPSFGWSHKSRI